MAASFPNGIKEFTTKVDGITTIVAEHVNSLQDEVVALETGLLTWTDWTPTQTGWTSLSGTFKYLRAGNIVFWSVTGLTGTSNGTTAKISLPVETADTSKHYGVFLGYTDNGGVNVSLGCWYSSHAGINFYNGITSLTSWTASGTKAIPGASGFYVVTEKAG